ncbi:hypothetical protein [Zooshikella ganghwensis]|nr:hypothetical protein [Zooshikella ganghwensis]
MYEDLALALDEPKNHDNLTSENTQRFIKAIQRPELMAEIEAVRKAHQCN